MTVEKIAAITLRGTNMRNSVRFYRDALGADGNPTESDLEEIAENIGAGEAICTRREVVNVVNRPQDIDDDEAMTFFGGEEGDADQSQG